MNYELKTNLDSVEYGIWDAENELWLTDDDDIEDFIKSNNAKTASKAIIDSVNMLLEELKSNIGLDLKQCYLKDD